MKFFTYLENVGQLIYFSCNHCFFSVDYDAPLSEAGDITEKFKALKEVIKKYNPDADKEGD